MNLKNVFTHKFTKQDALMASVCVLGLLLVTIEPSFAQPSVDQDAGGFQAQASTIGGGIKNAGLDVIFGNIGLLIGIAFAAFGAYQWLVKQNTAVGVGSIIFGAILALSDNLLEGVQTTLVSPVLNYLGGSNGGNTTP